MGADEEGTLDRLKAHRCEIVDPKIKEHHGRVVKTTGDGLLAEFPSVVDAVRCAAEVQRGMLDREPDSPDEQRIRLRIGINLGDVIAEGDDIFGDGVNVAARLEALAEPGGICVSGVVRDQIRGKLPYPLADKGEQSVKNIAEPIRVYALRPEAIADLPLPSMPISASHLRRTAPLVIAASAAAALVIAASVWWFWPTTTASPTPAVAAATPIAQPLTAPRLSIVVLPFANLSSDPDQQYFADGITEDVTTDLSRIAESFVISRNTAFLYRNKPIDTKTDAHLWAEQFDGDLKDLFALQNEITSRIAIALNVELSRREAARPTDNPDALDFILRARAAYWTGPSRDRVTEIINLYERALALDPHSVEAQSQIASMLA